MRAPPYSDQVDELFTTACIDDPHPLFARLRNRHPISRIGDTGVHLVATWELIDQALQREDDFSANLSGVLMRGDDGRPGVFELPGASRIIATADEPEHAVHRKLLQPEFNASKVQALECTVREWSNEAIASWIQDGAGDFMPIAELIPARVLASLLGLPDGDVSRHRTWAMMGGDILAGDVSHAQMSKLGSETVEMAGYLARNLEAARSTLQDANATTLLHVLARGVAAGTITNEEAVGISIILFGAGGESTAALIGNMVRRLAQAPDIADALREDPALIPRFVEEVARLEPPFKFHYRLVRRACELGGAELREGDRLMLVWASANRDAEFFDDPDTLKLDRPHPKQHMSFGRGSHFCIGAGIARLEAQVVCEELLGRAPGLSLDPDDAPVHARSIFVRRLARLPIRLRTT